MQSRGDRVVAAFSWSDSDGRRHQWVQALRVKDDRIIDMQDYGSVRPAIVLMRLRTAVG